MSIAGKRDNNIYLTIYDFLSIKRQCDVVLKESEAWIVEVLPKTVARLLAATPHSDYLNIAQCHERINQLNTDKARSARNKESLVVQLPDKAYAVYSSSMLLVFESIIL